MHRIVLAALVSLFLLNMQQAQSRHAVDHLRAQVQRGHDAGLSKTASTDCLECALLASGSSAVPSTESAVVAVVPVTARFVSAHEAVPPSAAPVYYRSRAPPALL